MSPVLARRSNGERQPGNLLATGGKHGVAAASKVRRRGMCRAGEATREGSDGGPAATRTWTSNVRPAPLPDQQQTSGAWNAQCCTAQTLVKLGRGPRSFERVTK